jgi:hypothetical protein
MAAQTAQTVTAFSWQTAALAAAAPQRQHGRRRQLPVAASGSDGAAVNKDKPDWAGAGA